MVRPRLGAILLALCAASPVFAQGTSPTAPPPPPPPPSDPAPTPAAGAPVPAPDASTEPYAPDAVLAEQIADQLATRAQELLDAKIYLDAKQLAVEALVKSPKGPAAERARYIIKLVNTHLDIKEDPAPTPPSEVVPVKPDEDVDTSPIDSSTRPFDPSRDPPPVQTSAVEGHDGKNAGLVHGALFGATLGAAIGALAKDDNPAAVAVPLSIGFGVGGGLLGRVVANKLGWDEAQIRTAGSISAWAGVAGGFFAEAATGAGDSTPSAGGILLGASIGSTAGLALGGALAKNHKLTRGDVALVDTLAGIGTVGGLTIGMLMQPAQSEAYSVNALLGAGAGVVIGIVAGPQTNTTPRRMLRVAGLAGAGGAIPFLLYAAIHDGSSTADERVTGLLSSVGLVAGAYLGFRLTRNMDVGLDVPDGESPRSSEDDAPVALVSRNSNGSWLVGGVGVTPLSNQLATNNRGATLTILGATF
jgi:hypothetical protein